MTRRHITTRLALVLAALLLPLSFALTAPAAHAAAAAPAAPAAAPRTAPSGSIFGPCNILQEGQVRNIGGNLYQCQYVRGVGYFWVSVGGSCPGAVPVIASKPAYVVC